MVSNILEIAKAGGYLVGPSNRSLSLVSVALACLVVAVTVALRARAVTTTDTSWLLTVGEMLLAGKTYGVDFIETNTPFVAWLYLPCIFLARASGIPVEAAVDAFVILIAVASAFFSLGLLTRRELLRQNAQPAMVFAVLAIFCIFPGDTFTQRDQIAAIVLFPWLCCMIIRSHGITPDVASCLVGGLGAAVTLSIKPQLACVVVPACLAAAFYARNWRVVFAKENIAAGLALGIILFALVVKHPDYWSNTVPLVRDMYLSPLNIREGIAQSHSILWMVLSTAVLIAVGKAFFAPRLFILWIASAGFFIAFVLQGKLFAYQAYPMLALALIVASIAVVDLWPAQQVSDASGHVPKAGNQTLTLLKPMALLCLAIWIFIRLAFGLFASHVDWSAFADEIRRHTERPTLLALSGDIAVGHPVTRLVGGTWVGTYPSLWVSVAAQNERVRNHDAATLARINAYDRANLLTLRNDVIAKKPDLLLVDMFSGPDWLQFARSDADLAKELQMYERAGSVEVTRSGERIDVWVRRHGQPSH